VLVISFTPNLLKSQDRDLHFTQYSMSPINLNPALTGVFNGDIRYTGNYRNQWQSVPVGFNTVSMAYDQKIYNVKVKNGLFGVGGIFNYDQAGDSKLRAMQLQLAGSYTQRLTPRNFLTLGLTGGISQRAFKSDDLTWDEQFVNGKYSSSNPITESFARSSKLYPDFGFGLNWHYQVPNSKRTQLDFGASYFHAHSPNVSFYDDSKVNIQPRLSIQLGSSFKLSSRFDVIINGNYYAQDKSAQAIAGGGFRFHFDDRIGRETALQLGAEYRFLEKDAWAPVLTVYHKQWKVGLSYDFNISDFQVATNGNGGPEIGIMYIITKVKPLPILKSCPIF
jgi:type IX secretion system PorP/SprF family membrane protein